VICAQASDDAIIKFGAVFDDALGDAMRVTVVATGLNRPSDFAAGAKRLSMSRLAPGGGAGSGSPNQVRGGGLRETPPQSILRQTALQPAVRAASAQQAVRAGLAPRQPASNTSADAQQVLTADIRGQRA
jgi:cell division protein FtsZ